MKPAGGLLFVYNADAGLFNTLTDIAHKLFSPQTYPCALCSLSHGLLSERKAWRKVIESLGVPCEFLHRDEAQFRYGIEDDLPAVYRQLPEGLQLCLSASEIAACTNLDALAQRLRMSCGKEGEA